MATTLPAGGRLIGEVVRGIVTVEKLRKLAQAIPQEQTKEGDCAGEKDETQCNQCKLQAGALLPARPRRGIRKQTKINYDYQLYIANLKAGPEQFCYCDKATGAPVSNFDFSLAGRAWSAFKGEPQPDPERLNVTEWLYSGVWFDGFWRGDCTVVDAKGRYAQFLGEDGLPKRGFQSRVVFPGLVKEAKAHAAVVAPAMPQAKVQWHFMERPTYLAVKNMIPPPVTVHYTQLPPIQA